MALTIRNITPEQKATRGDRAPGEIRFLKHCHDCGRFVERDKWIDPGKTEKFWPLCSDCARLYDSPWDM